MKKLAYYFFSLFILLIGYSMPAQAQQPFYVYRNDGVINAFITTEVDSIVYSFIGTDSIIYDEPVVQEIYTLDSIFRIPLSLIDSIGFTTPTTKYKAGVIVLDGDIRKYIYAQDSLILYFSNYTPYDLIPDVGNQLVTTKIDEVIKHAFIGQVSHVNYLAEGIEIVCVPTSLSDVFECYYGFINESNTTPKRNRSITDGVFSTNGFRTLEPGIIKLPLVSSKTIQYELNDNLVMGVEGGEIELSITPVIKYSAFTIIHPNYGINISVSVISDFTVDESYLLSGMISGNFDKTIMPRIPISVPEALVDFFFEIGITGSMNGTACLNQQLEQKYRHVFHWEWDSNGDTNLNGINSFKRLSSNSAGEFILSGSLSVGAYAKVGIAPIATARLKVSEVSLRAEGGVIFEGSIVPKRVDLENSLKSTALYNLMKGCGVSFDSYFSVSSEVKFSKWSISHKIPRIFELPLQGRRTIWQKQCVPNFSSTKAVLFKDAIIATTIANGNVKEGNVGFALIDNNNGDAIYKYCMQYSGPSAVPDYTFDNVLADNSYTIYPLYTFWGYPLLAEPYALAGYDEEQSEDQGEEQGDNNEENDDDNLEHKYVDLGLSVKWATCNIGASKPDERGNLYAWGEISTKSEYTKENYKWYKKEKDTNGNTIAGYTKYCYHSFINDSPGVGYRGGAVHNLGYGGYTDNRPVLEPSDDVAHVRWGGYWRMPTISECAELFNNCSQEVVTDEDGKQIYAVRFISQINGNSIVIPCSVWSSSQYEWSRSDVGRRYNPVDGYNGYNSYYCYFINEADPVCNFEPYCFDVYEYRYNGLPVRPVYADNDQIVTSIYLSESNVEIELGQSKTITAYTKNNYRSNNAPVEWYSTNDNIATVNSNGVIYAKGDGCCEIIAVSGLVKVACHLNVVKSLQEDYVDLGLSVKWAKCNIGASRPENYGNYYAWGETITKNCFTRDNYKFYKESTFIEYDSDGSSQTSVIRGYTKYVYEKESYSWGYKGYYDNKEVLDEFDDVAHVVKGGKWRMPSNGEFGELEDCLMEKTYLNGIYGYKITSTIIGYHNRSIFLPAGGFRSESDEYSVTNNCYYWTNMRMNSYYSLGAHWAFCFGPNRDTNKHLGLLIRPVRP